MSDPRFRPREMAVPADRHLFGKARRIDWLDAHTNSEESRIEAARLQHFFAVRMTVKIREEGHTIRSYAVLAGVGYDRMAKVLRGEAVMRLEDVSDAERLLGGILPMDLVQGR